MVLQQPLTAQFFLARRELMKRPGMESIKIVPKRFLKEKVRHSKDFAVESLMGHFFPLCSKAQFSLWLE